MTSRSRGLRRTASGATLLFLTLVAEARAFDRHRYEEYPELEGKTVEQVLLLGNNKAQGVVILLEMRKMVGKPVHSHDLCRDWERILDFGLFAEVEVDAVPARDNV